MKFSEIKKSLAAVEIKEVQTSVGVMKVKQYLPAEEKMELINTVTVLAGEDFVKPFILDMVFCISLVQFYTDITFTKTEKNDLYKMYDALERAGIIDLVVDNIPESEYNTLYESVEEQVKNYSKYQTSTAFMIQNIKESVENFVPQMAKLLDEIDLEKVKMVQELASTIK